MTPTSQAVILFLLCKSLATFREMFAGFKSYLFLHLFFSSTHLNGAVLISSAGVLSSHTGASLLVICHHCHTASSSIKGCSTEQEKKTDRPH